MISSLYIRRSIVVAALTLSALAGTATAKQPSERFQDAERLMRAGQLKDALVLFSNLRDEYPGDVDYSLARAQVLAGLDRDTEALIELTAAAALAPRYEDVSRLRYAILTDLKGAKYRVERDELRRKAAEQYPQATWWRIPTDPAVWTVVAGAAYDELSDGLPGWNNQFVELSRERHDRNRYHLGLARSERYITESYALGFGAEHTAPSGWFAGVGMTLADDSVIQPDLAYTAYVGKPIDHDFVLGLRYKRQEYTTATVSAFVGTIEKYHGNFRFAYGLTQARLHGASGFANHVLTTNWYYSDRASAGVTISGGREAESLGNGQILESDVSGVSINGRYSFDKRYAVRWWLGTHKQGDFYRRRYLGLAVSIRI